MTENDVDAGRGAGGVLTFIIIAALASLVTGALLGARLGDVIGADPDG